MQQMFSRNTKAALLFKDSHKKLNNELDFDQTFAPVIRIDSVCSLFAICAANDLRIVQVDCKNVFLHSQRDFEIYVQQPEGFVDANHPDAVLLLNKALYGLKHRLL